MRCTCCWSIREWTHNGEYRRA